MNQHGLFCLLLLSVILNGCVTTKDARHRYDATRDYRSLKHLANQLAVGMQKADVEQLLGRPLDHPGGGTYCYLSNREESIEGFRVPVGLVVHYNDSEGRETAILQHFYLVPIGE